MLKSYEMGYKQVRMLKHDIEGQYSMVKSLLEQGEYEKAKEYMSSMQTLFEPLYHHIYSENRTINLAINLAVEQGKEYDIDFNVKVACPKKFPLTTAL